MKRLRIVNAHVEGEPRTRDDNEPKYEYPVDGSSGGSISADRKKQPEDKGMQVQITIPDASPS